jgi:hypothetical protein
MNKNITYKLNEANLRNLIGNYEVGFDETLWQETEKNLDTLGLQRKPSLKVGAKRIALFACLVVLGGGLVAFINYNSGHKKSSAPLASAPVEEKNSVNMYSDAAERTGLKAANDVPALLFNRHSAMAEPVAEIITEKKEEPVLAENKAAIKAPEEIRKPEPVVQTAPEVKKEVVIQDNSEKKRKKKKRRKNNSSENENPATTHSAGEDDVIITE